MKLNAKSKIIILLITVGILFALSPITTYNLCFNAGNKYKGLEYNENLKTSAVSGKIHIDNNWSAAKAAGICTGNGTYSEPYVIEDLVIDGEGSGSCILINNSDVYFKIENCSVFNSGGYFSTGIKLSYVSNSRLIDNNCSSNVWGIYLHNSNYNTVSGNNVNNNYWGISLGWGVNLGGNYNIISGNTANDNSGSGIYLNGNYNTASGNTASNNGMGIDLWGNNNIISGNSVNNNGWGIILGSNYNTVSGNTANDNSGSGIYLNGDSNTVSGNTANYNSDGISLYNSDDNNISGNIANHNNGSGIYLKSSNYYNTVSGNTANYNSDGISLYNSDNNNISGNTLIGNDKCILEENCEGNIFENNDCGERFPFELIILISSISGGAVIGVATILLIRRKRKRMQ